MSGHDERSFRRFRRLAIAGVIFGIVAIIMGTGSIVGLYAEQQAREASSKAYTAQTAASIEAERAQAKADRNLQSCHLYANLMADHEHLSAAVVMDATADDCDLATGLLIAPTASPSTGQPAVITPPVIVTVTPGSTQSSQPLSSSSPTHSSAGSSPAASTRPVPTATSSAPQPSSVASASPSASPSSPSASPSPTCQLSLLNNCVLGGHL